MIQTSVAVAVFIALILTAAAQPTPQPKVGACPSGYRESGGYCAPMSRRAGRNPEDRPMSIWVHAIGRVLP
jgi:hypothetical protein